MPKVNSYYFKLDSTLTKVNVAQVTIVSCYVFASQYHSGIKKLSKEPFHIKIDCFQPGSTLVILSCSTRWPGKANKDKNWSVYLCQCDDPFAFPPLDLSLAFIVLKNIMFSYVWY